MRRSWCALVVLALAVPAPASAASYRRISASPLTKAGGADLTADGRHVAFIATGQDNIQHAYVFNTKTNALEQVDVSSAGASGRANAWTVAISDDGRYVAFSSSAAELVPGDTNQAEDAFVRDRKKRTTKRVSVTPKGAELKSDPNGTARTYRAGISGDGKYVFFDTDANVLGDPPPPHAFFNVLYRRHLASGKTEAVSVGTDGKRVDISTTLSTDGRGAWRAVSRDGRYAAFVKSSAASPSGVGSTSQEVLVRDLAKRRTVSATAGLPASDMTYTYPTMDAKGELVAFGGHSMQNAASGYYLRNLRSAKLTEFADHQLALRRSLYTEKPEAALSGNGKYLFYSHPNTGGSDTAASLGYTVMQVAIGSNGTTARSPHVSADKCPVSFQGDCNIPIALAASYDGSALAFSTSARIDSSDTNDFPDLYLHR